MKSCTVESNIVKLPGIRLDRNLYLDVKKRLELIGGKWKGGKVQGFVFPGDPSGLLSQIAGGQKRDLKKEYQFFETPDRLADRITGLAEIREGDAVLEPSAGRGAIVKAVRRAFPQMQVSGYELMDINRAFLGKLPGFMLLGADFLTECEQTFDVIVANPPFSGNRDIEHIRKMYGCLKPGGRLVSVASTHWRFAAGKQEETFRKWISGVRAEVHDIARGEFKQSGTMVETCMVIIRK